MHTTHEPTARQMHEARDTVGHSGGDSPRSSGRGHITRSQSASAVSNGGHGGYGRPGIQSHRSHPTTPCSTHAHDSFHYDTNSVNKYQHRRVSDSPVTTSSYSDKQITGYCHNTSVVPLEPRAVKKWAEYTARRSVVKFRTRKSASKRSSLNRQSVDLIPPSPKVNAILQNQYEKCRNPDTAFSDRLTAVLYCWYLGWIQDVYSSLTGGDNQRSGCKWLLSCVLVSMAAFMLIALVAILVHGVVFFLAMLGHAAVNFMLFVTGAFLCTVSGLTAFSYFDQTPVECDVQCKDD